MILVQILELLIEYIQRYTLSYGWSIILLSLVISVILFPFLCIGEALKRRDRSMKASMQDELDELEDVKNAKEKYFYTREIYRRHDYKGISSLLGATGLIVQIPFLLASFMLLSDYVALQGVAFGPIKNLYEPDAILNLGSFSINLMPLVMTVVNMLGIYLMRRQITKKETRNLMLIGLVFLVAFYSLSSALVLFWTANNVFAVGRSHLSNLLVSDPRINGKNGILVDIAERTSDHFSKRFPYYIAFLIASVPILSFYQQNSTELSFYYAAALIALTGVLSMVLFAFMQMLIGSRSKALLILALVAALFFSFGHMYEYLQTFSDSRSLRRVLWGAYIGIGSAIGAWICLTRTKLDKAYGYIGVFTVCFALVIGFRTVLSEAQGSWNVNSLNGFSEQNIQDSVLQEAKPYPDIYHIVLDGYANSKIMAEMFGYSNSDFEDFLQLNGFKVADDARCNYVQTDLSLPSTLNMDYFDHSLPIGKTSWSGKSGIHNSTVIRYLRSKGYYTVHLSSGWWMTDYNPTADLNLGQKAGFSDLAISFLRTTLLTPLARHFAQTSYRDEILNIFDGLLSLGATPKPTYVFAHIVSPHPPYIFGRDGALPDAYFSENNSWETENIDAYLAQLEYLNDRVKEVVSVILEADENSIFVLQSDHGSAFKSPGEDWSDPTQDFVRERSLILSATRLPKSYDNQLYPTMSSVNTYRTMFNSVFEDRFEILQDQTYFSSYYSKSEFIDVTTILPASD